MNRTSNLILRGLLLATSCLAGTATLAHPVRPTGSNVVSGKARVTHPSSSRTVVRQSTDKALIDWDSFSIGKGASVVFRQPDQGSITVNRVIGPGSSKIYGDLTANGQIWIINGNGILFGKGSQTNVEGLIATTSDITDSDFKKGRYDFSKPSGNPDAAVVNAGTITAGKDGSVVLSAPQVSNQGLIQARLGTVVMGGARAFTVDMDGDNLIRYQISKAVRETPQDSSGAPADSLVSNSGTIKADGGRVLMTARAAQNVQDDVINNTGIVEATSVRSQNGTIILDAGANGTVDAGGTLNASGDRGSQTGGNIRVTGQTVAVERGADLDASGRRGGGTVLLGGNFHGHGHMRQAENTSIAKGARVDANAIASGNGGRVAVWSTGQTIVAGRISARGGRMGGDGGFVETSGGHLAVGGLARIDTAAHRGKAGSWLLDPENIVIEGCSGDGCITSIDGGTISVGGSGTDIIDPTAVENTLENGSNVLLEASNEIDVLDDVIYSSANSLSLLSEGDIDISANIQNSSTGDINLVAGWDGTTPLANIAGTPGAYGNNNGTVTITTFNDNDDDPDDPDEASEGELRDVAVGTSGGTTMVAADNLVIDGEGHIAQLGYTGDGGGDIAVNLTGDLTLNATNVGGNAGYAQIGNGDGLEGGGESSGVTGDITLDIGGNLAVDADGLVDVGDYSDSGSVAWIGNVAQGGPAPGNDESGNVSITMGGGGLFSSEVIQDDLGNSASNGGDVSLGFKSGPVTWYALNYDSPHNFTLASGGDLLLLGSLQNAGSGDMTFIAGWDGTTPLSSVANTASAWGNNGGSVTVGGESASGDAHVGTAGGTTTVLGYDLDVDAQNGNAQLGYYGDAGGNIIVNLKDDLSVTSSGVGYAQVGNGILESPEYDSFVDFFSDSGHPGGDITISANNVTVDSEGAAAQIGNGSAFNSGATGDIQITASGNILVSAANASFDGSYAQIGNGGAYSFGSLSGSVDVTADGNITLQASTQDCGCYAQIGNGGFDFDTAGGSVTVEAGGNITLTGGAQSYTYAQIGNGGDGGEGGVDGDILVQSGGLLSLTGASLVGNIAGDLENPGTFGGDVSITAVSGSGLDDSLGHDIAGGDFTLVLTGNSALNFSSAFDYSSPYALSISNGGAISFSGDLANAGSGDITLDAGGGLTFGGNVSNAGTGKISLTSGGDFTAPDITSGSGGIVLDAGGQLTVTGTLQTSGDGGISLTSGTDMSVGHSLSVPGSGDIVLDAGGVLTVDGSISNSGTGKVSLTSGSDLTAPQITSGSGGIIIDAAGMLTVSDALTTTGDGGISLTSGTDMSVANDLSTPGNGDIVLDAGGGLSLGGDISNASGTGKVSITSGSDFTAPAIASGSGGIVIDAAGKLTVSDAISTTGDGGISLTSGDDMSVANGLSVPGSGDIVLDAGGVLTVDGSISDSGTGKVSLTSGGDLTAPAITSGSGGILIDAAGALTVSDALTTTGDGGISLTSGDDMSIASGVSVPGSGDIVLDAGGLLSVGGDIANSGTGKVSISSGGDLTAPNITSGSGGISVDSAGNLTVSGTVETAGNGGISLTSGDDMSIGTDLTVSGSGDIVLDAGGALAANGDISNSSGSGKISLTSGGDMSTNAVDSGSGDVTLDSGGNLALNGQVSTGSGTIKLHAGGDMAVAATVQSTGGDITVKSGGDTTIGGNGANGDVFVGSQNGSLSVDADNLVLDAANGFAQLGYNGSGSGAIAVTASGDVTLNAGGSGQYAQIGNGGYQTSGDESGDISVTAGGEVALNAGSGNNAYAQIGNGGSHANQGAHGYSNTGDIDISGSDVALNGGNGDGSYAQVGNGGYLVGQNLAGGTATNSGDITIDADNSVTLTGGSGSDAYVQVGNGGDGVNSNASGSASGSNAGDIVVAVANSNGTEVTLSAGGGSDAYAQIGNGGFGNNASNATNVNFTDSGNISVSDLTLTGSDIGDNAYAQVGNGDDAKSGDANVSGDITISSNGTIKVTSGKKGGALIGNATGRGTVTGTVTGYTPPSNNDNNNGAITSLIQSTQTTDIFNASTTNPFGDNGSGLPGDNTDQNSTGPLDQLASGGDEGTQDSDDVTDSIGRSLNHDKGGKQVVVSQTLIPGVLRQTLLQNSQQPRGIPPADQDFSSWGNEALWRW